VDWCFFRVGLGEGWVAANPSLTLLKCPKNWIFALKVVLYLVFGGPIYTPVRKTGSFPRGCADFQFHLELYPGDFGRN